MKLLRIDSSARESSVSRQLTEAFVVAWKHECPNGTILVRDLARVSIPAIGDDWVRGARLEPTKRSAVEREALDVSDQLISELEAVQIVLIGAPMYNFTIAASLKSWIDQIVRPGRTVEYGPAGPRGLLEGRKVIVLTSRGGAYADSPTHSAHDYQEPYLRAILAFIGLTNVTFIHAENQLRRDRADSARNEAFNRIHEFVQQTRWS